MTCPPPLDPDTITPHDAVHDQLRRAIHASHARHHPHQLALGPDISEADLPSAPLAGSETRQRARWAWLLQPAAKAEHPLG